MGIRGLEKERLKVMGLERERNWGWDFGEGERKDVRGLEIQNVILV